MSEIIFKKEVYEIVAAAFEVHNVLGPGFLEAVYQEALAIEFRLRNLPFEEQKQLHLTYKQFTLKKRNIPDFYCYDKIVIEIKASLQLLDNDTSQILNSLKASQQKIGLLINFGQRSLLWKRYINPNVPRLVQKRTILG
ncbi:GxxExxY protein [candidate division KSB1 bacterium]|nr:GxxExxY protein [candidate division KSB1 bacterium]